MRIVAFHLCHSVRGDKDDRQTCRLACQISALSSRSTVVAPGRLMAGAFPCRIPNLDLGEAVAGPVQFILRQTPSCSVNFYSWISRTRPVEWSSRDRLDWLKRVSSERGRPISDAVR